MGSSPVLARRTNLAARQRTLTATAGRWRFRC